MNCEGCGKKQPQPNVRSCFSNFLEKLIKTNKNLGQDKIQNIKNIPPKCKSEVLALETCFVP
jgi:hypothetical protein